MKIDDDHLYHGAALIQIAEHPQFTAINAIKIKNNTVRSGYKINDDIAVYLKYASKPTPAYDEYAFTFTNAHLNEMSQIAQSHTNTFAALICVKDREICLLSYDEIVELRQRREKANGGSEPTLSILVTIPKGKSLRVYVNAPNKKKTFLGKQLVISRNAFPNSIFE